MSDRPSPIDGSWRSPIPSTTWSADQVLLGEPWLDGDDLYWLEAGRPKPVAASSSAGADGTTEDGHPPPFERPDARPRIRWRLVHGRRRGHRLTRTSGRPPLPARPGRRRSLPITPEGSVALRRPALRRRPAPVRLRPRGPLGRGRGPERDRRRRPRRRARAARPRTAARTSSRRRARRPTATGWPGSSGTTRACPGTPRAAGRGDRRRWDARRADLAAGGPDESIAQPEWSPDGGPPLRHRPERAGGTCTACPRAHGSSALAPMEAEFADPAWIFGRSSYGFLRRWQDRRCRAAAAAAIACSTSHRATSSARSTRRTPSSRASIGPLRTSSCWPGAGPPDVIVPLDPETLATGQVLRRASAIALDPGAISFPEPIEFPTTGGREAHALFYPPRNPEFVGPDGERPPLVTLSHGGPTSNASTALDLRDPVLHQPRHRGRGRGLRRQHRLRPRVPPQLNEDWGIVDVDDCVGRRAPSSRTVATSDPERMAIAGRQRRRLHDARRAGLPRRLRGRHQPVRHRRPRDARRRHPQVRIALHGPSHRPYPEWPTATASARRSTTSTGSAAPVLILQGARRQGRPARARPRPSGRASPRTGSRTPTCLRRRGPRLPRRRRSGARRGPSCRSSARSSASSPPTTIEPVELVRREVPAGT